MVKLWFLLSPENRAKLVKLKEDWFGKKLLPPRPPTKAIEIQLSQPPEKMETTKQIGEIMQEPPPYTISVNGRHDSGN
jgi:hypothetical protein